MHLDRATSVCLQTPPRRRMSRAMLMHPQRQICLHLTRKLHTCGGRADFPCQDMATAQAAQRLGCAHSGRLAQLPEGILVDQRGCAISPGIAGQWQQAVQDLHMQQYSDTGIASGCTSGAKHALSDLCAPCIVHTQTWLRVCAETCELPWGILVAGHTPGFAGLPSASSSARSCCSSSG